MYIYIYHNVVVLVRISLTLSLCLSVYLSLSLSPPIISPSLLSIAPCLVCTIWIVLKIGGRWPYRCCFVGCCFQDLFCMTHIILVEFLSSFFSLCLASNLVVHPYSKRTQPLLGKNCVLFDRIGWFPYDRQPIDSSPCHRQSLIDIIFSWWDAASEVVKLIH